MRRLYKFNTYKLQECDDYCGDAAYWGDSAGHRRNNNLRNKLLDVSNKILNFTDDVFAEIVKFEIEIKDIIVKCYERRYDLVKLIIKHRIELESKDLDWLLVEVDKLMRGFYYVKVENFHTFNRNGQLYGYENVKSIEPFLTSNKNMLNNILSIKRDIDIRCNNICGMIETKYLIV